jgi:hypothetical protein
MTQPPLAYSKESTDSKTRHSPGRSNFHSPCVVLDTGASALLSLVGYVSCNQAATYPQSARSWSGQRLSLERRPISSLAPLNASRRPTSSKDVSQLLYEMATIYSLETEGFVWYVGSTTRELRVRLNEHRAHNRVCIPNEYDWEIRLLQRCPIERRLERERAWFDKLQPLLNKQRPNMPNLDASYHKEWRLNNPGKIQAIRARYREKQNKSDSLLD